LHIGFGEFILEPVLHRDGQSSMCCPRESGDPAVGHDEATTLAGRPPKAAQSKPCSVVVFWMLAFASMTLVKHRPCSIVAANRELIHLLLGVALVQLQGSCYG
jgi:hypothetical protein